MARIIYGLTSQGRGHSSRVTAMAEALEARGHELLFVAGGEAGELLREQGREVIDVPVLRHLMHNNEIRLWTSLAWMGLRTVQTLGVARSLARRFVEFRPDLLISDFESYSIRAAQKIGLPLMCFNHQQVLTHTRYEVPRKYAWDAWVARLVVNTAMPNRPEHVLISSFFYPPLRDEQAATLVAPILRKAVRESEPSCGEHVLVYHNDPTGLSGLLEAMGDNPEHRFVAYNFEVTPETRARLGNVEFKQPDVRGFLADLASAKAVISTAGFTLISEALYLGKPMLLMPNGGIFEQTLNALYLEREGLGEAILHRVPSGEDLRGFLDRHTQYADRRAERLRCGNDEAVECIEGVLARVASRRLAS
jgi:uncharacterized protein (TIGR00661 family)